MEYHHLLLQTSCIWRFELKFAVLLFSYLLGGCCTPKRSSLFSTVSERSSGARVPGAAVHVRSNAFDALATSDAEGNFKIDVPSAGAYRVSVEQPGSRLYLQLNVQVAGPSESR